MLPDDSKLEIARWRSPNLKPQKEGTCAINGLISLGSKGPAIWTVSKGPQSQFRYCLWYRSSHGTDFDISEIASPVEIPTL